MIISVLGENLSIMFTAESTVQPLQNSGLRNLYAQILSSAIHDLEKVKESELCNAEASNNALAAALWLMSQGDPVVTFSQCCAILDLQEEIVLESLYSRGLLTNYTRNKIKEAGDGFIYSSPAELRLSQTC